MLLAQHAPKDVEGQEGRIQALPLGRPIGQEAGHEHKLGDSLLLGCIHQRDRALPMRQLQVSFPPLRMFAVTLLHPSPGADAAAWTRRCRLACELGRSDAAAAGRERVQSASI